MAEEIVAQIAGEIPNFVNALANSTLIQHFQKALFNVTQDANEIPAEASEAMASNQGQGSTVVGKMAQLASSWYNQEFAAESSDFKVQQAMSKMIGLIPAIGSLANLFFTSFAKVNGVDPSWLNPNDPQFKTATDDHGAVSSQTTGQDRAAADFANLVNAAQAGLSGQRVPNFNPQAPKNTGTLPNTRTSVAQTPYITPSAPSKYPGLGSSFVRAGTMFDDVGNVIGKRSAFTSTGYEIPGKWGGFDTTNAKVITPGKFQPASGGPEVPGVGSQANTTGSTANVGKPLTPRELSTSFLGRPENSDLKSQIDNLIAENNSNGIDVGPQIRQALQGSIGSNVPNTDQTPDSTDQQVASTDDTAADTTADSNEQSVSSTTDEIAPPST